MNYQLSPEEMAQVRELVETPMRRELFGVLSNTDEDEACRLAEKIKEWLK